MSSEKVLRMDEIGEGLQSYAYLLRDLEVYLKEKTGKVKPIDMIFLRREHTSWVDPVYLGDVLGIPVYKTRLKLRGDLLENQLLIEQGADGLTFWYLLDATGNLKDVHGRYIKVTEADLEILSRELDVELAGDIEETEDMLENFGVASEVTEADLDILKESFQLAGGVVEAEETEDMLENFRVASEVTEADLDTSKESFQLAGGVVEAEETEDMLENFGVASEVTEKETKGGCNGN